MKGLGSARDTIELNFSIFLPLLSSCSYAEKCGFEKLPENSYGIAIRVMLAPNSPFIL